MSKAGFSKLEDAADDDVAAPANTSTTDDSKKEQPETRVRGRTGAKKRQSMMKQSNSDGKYTQQQYMLLGILDAYTFGDVSEDEEETWLRRTPLLVMVYEGIIQGLIDYDYAPAFIFFDQTFWQVNLSQQFITDLDELVLDSFVKAIKLTTKYHSSGMAYQITESGREMLKKGFGGSFNKDGEVEQAACSYEEVKDMIDAFTMIEAKNPLDPEEVIMKRSVVEFVSDEGFFRLAPGMVHEFRVPDDVGGDDGDDDGGGGEDDEVDCLVFHQYKTGKKIYQPIQSDVTETEDVSYVTSPWIPNVLVDNKASMKEFYSNAHRTDECAMGQSNIKDELEELITLNNVKVLVAEWIPFGSNQIFALNDKLGSSERMKGGLFLATRDMEPNRSIYKMAHSTGLTKVHVVDHQMDRFITFMADIQYEEEEGINQVEEFGVSCRDHGGCYYGMQMEAILNNTAESISIDFLSRVLIDVMDDSSELMGSLISNYQIDLLDCVFNGKSDKRSKYSVFMAEDFALPDMDEDEKEETVEALLNLLDNDKNYENELKQIIGDVQWKSCFDEKRGIVIGNVGLLYLGNAEMVSDILSLWGTIRGMNLFHQAFYRRIFTLNDSMATLREDIDTAFTDPNSGTRLRSQHASAVEVTIKLTQVREFLSEALEMLLGQLKEYEEEMKGDSVDVARKTLWDTLNLPAAVKDVQNRITDMSKNTAAIQDALSELFNGIENIERIKMFTIQEAINENTRNLEDQAKASERGSRALEIMQVILAGNLAFEILDRYTEENPMDPENPIMWFLLSMGMFFLVAVMLVTYSQRAAAAADKVLMMKFKINKKVDAAAMRAFILDKDPDAEAYETFQTENDIRKVQWAEEEEELWKTGDKDASIPDMVLLYDHKFGFLFQVYMTVTKCSNMMSDKEYLDCFMKQLQVSGVLPMESAEGVENNLLVLMEEEKISLEEAAKEEHAADGDGDVEMSTLPNLKLESQASHFSNKSQYKNTVKI